MRTEVSGLVLMPLAFWIGSHWGLTGIAFGWIFAYPFLGLAEYWKTMKTIDLKLGDYIAALRPALDGSVAMALAVVVLQRTLPPGRSPWLRLMLEIGGGAAAYIGTITLLHRERVMHFLSIARRLRGPKLKAEAGVAGS
jgi:PST family polysaccharide transporter